MIQRESKSSIRYRHWLRANPQEPHWFECKDTGDKDYLPFSAVEEQQINFALAIEGDKGVVIRIMGGGGEPDYKYARGEPAYFVIKYPKGFVAIRVFEFVREREESKRKSLTWERACEIAHNVIET